MTKRRGKRNPELYQMAAIYAGCYGKKTATRFYSDLIAYVKMFELDPAKLDPVEAGRYLALKYIEWDWTDQARFANPIMYAATVHWAQREMRVVTRREMAECSE